MARIRNIKPTFFRHEVLQDLEAANPGAHTMLVYIGLWTQCDAAGIFPWKPRQLKLDILPFLDFSIEGTLAILADAGFLQRYTADGAEWGYIPTFAGHQRITGKEATEGEKYPKPGNSAPGNNRETTGKQPVAQERSTGKDIRKGELEYNAHAHEDFPENKKNEPAEESLAAAPDRDFDNTPLGHFAECYKQICAWGETDAGHAEIVQWKRITGYRDSLHGPTTDELAKFVSYHLGAKSTETNRRQFIAEPLAYFRDRFPGWLTNAKSWNRPPKARGKPPDNAREYTSPARRQSTPNKEPAALAALLSTQHTRT